MNPRRQRKKRLIRLNEKEEPIRRNLVINYRGNYIHCKNKSKTVQKDWTLIEQELIRRDNFNNVHSSDDDDDVKWSSIWRKREKMHVWEALQS